MVPAKRLLMQPCIVLQELTAVFLGLVGTVVTGTVRGEISDVASLR